MVKKQIDGIIRTVAPEFTTADANYAAAKASETISGRADKAEVLSRGGDFAGRMATQATQLLANPKYLRGFTPDEVEQLRQISEGTASGEALRKFNLGGKLGSAVGAGLGASVGAGVGGPVGAVIGIPAGMAVEGVVSKIVTGLGNRLTANQVNTLTSAVRSRSPLGQQLIKAHQEWQDAIATLKAAPTAASLSSAATASRSFAGTLSQAGVKIRPSELLRANQEPDNK